MAKKKAATKNYKSYKESTRPKLGRFKDYEGSFKGTLKEYMRKWEAFYEANKNLPDWSLDYFRKFYEAEGEYIDERGLKYRPNPERQLFEGGKRTIPGKMLSNTSDAGALQRIHRAEILTHMFGGTPATTGKLKYKNELGEVVEVHHRFANAEFAPFIDDIIEDLQAPKGSKQYKQGMEKLNAGRKYFKDSPYFAGDVYENFEGLTKPQHRGKGPSVHNQLGPVKEIDPKDLDAEWANEFENWMGSDITESMGKTPFPEGADTKLSFKKGYPGIQVDPNKPPVPTGDYIRSLPWSQEESFTFTERGKGFKKGKAWWKYTGAKPARHKQSRWSALEELLDHSGPIRDEIAEKAKLDPRLKSAKEIAHVKAGGRPPTPGKSWRKIAQESPGGLFPQNMMFADAGGGTAALRHVGALEDPAKWALRRAGSLIPIAGVALDELDRRARTEDINKKLGTWGYEGSYQHRLDQLQLRLSEGTLATSFWAEPVNIGAGLTNLAIDVGRTITEEDKRKNAVQTARNIGAGVDNLFKASLSTFF